MTNWADPNTVADKAATWSEAALSCRLNRHAWPGLRHRLTLVSHGTGYYEVAQRCIRQCGVGRKTTLNEHGYQLEPWAMDYSKAGPYLMIDDKGKSLGRIDHRGRAGLWLTAIKGATVREIPDE
jgi:hypothetical protein